jgi:GNAT superfamily N-acetyltransferase
MEAHFEQVEFDEIRDDVRRHIAALPAAFDSYLERRILESNHYRIVVAGESAGFFSIRNGSQITQFAIADRFKRHGQRAFLALRHMEKVQFAFVPTFDEFYLSHALDDYRQLAMWAYLFADVGEPQESAEPDLYSLRPAEPSDAEFISHEPGDLFDKIEQRIAAGEIFVTLRRDEPVGFGFRESSVLYGDVASVGMQTIERFRQQGVGTATIRMMISENRRMGLRAVAGCWYYNHFSKRTLERAGMYSQTRLLKVDY